MVDKFLNFIYQIEINTIASSMGFFSDSLKDFHKYFSNKYPELYSRYLDSSTEENKVTHKGKQIKINFKSTF